MTKKIPVTIVTGFLGAGKTTLINQALHEEHNLQIAVVVNEFGEIGVDHQLMLDVEEEVFQLNNGCICCALRSDIANVLHAILNVTNENNRTVDHVLIETTGIADPSPIAQTFSRVEFLVENFYLDAVLTLVDAEHISSQLQKAEEPAKQIAFADKIIMTKKDKVTSEALKKVIAEVKTINPFAEIEAADMNLIHLRDVIGLNLFEKNADDMKEVRHLLEEASDVHDEDCTCGCHEHHDRVHHHHAHDEHGHHHHHHEHSQIGSFVFTTQTPLTMAYVQRWLNELVFMYGEELYRYKGILNIEGERAQVIFQGVNMSLDFSLGKTWKTETPESVLVFIGKDLPEEVFAKSFDDMVAASKKTKK